MRRVLLLAAAVAVTGGCKCKPAPGPAPVNTGGPVVGKAQAVDLREAMMTVFPDGRGVRVLDASASLQRQLRYRVPHGQALNELMRPPIAEKGFRPPEAGDPPMALAMKPPFQLMGTPLPGGLALELALPLTSEDFGKLVQSPSPMTTEQLQAMVPTPKEAKVVSDTFFFSVQYQGPPAKLETNLLGLVQLLQQNGWTLTTAPPGFSRDGGAAEDGGASLGASEQTVSFELERPATGGKVRAAIGSGVVAVTYVQPLVTAGVATDLAR